MSKPQLDSIAALATPPGRGGVGIVRVSGPLVPELARALLGVLPSPRRAHYGPFQDARGELLDEGIGLFFPAPHSFTGEDVLELQGHGGPLVMDRLLAEILRGGARLAHPGEFSQRAFVNDKLDLAQAEAIADLIDSGSEQAARSALRSLKGEFSRHIGILVEELTELRVYVEAAIDFPEEEIDFLGEGRVATQLNDLLRKVQEVQGAAHQGSLLREGMNVVIAGRPNAGKSSLLNALAGVDSAIVTEIAGTTRDLLRERIHIDGMPLHITDTAGLREGTDAVERIGVDRAWQAIAEADRVLMVVDASLTAETDARVIWPEFMDQLPSPELVTVIRNKIDLSSEEPGLVTAPDQSDLIRLSASTGQGLDLLRDHLKACMGFTSAEDGILARRRHLNALERARALLVTGQDQLNQAGAGELLAEDLRQAQRALGEITGEVTSEDLLGEIFSSFCIGK